MSKRSISVQLVVPMLIQEDGIVMGFLLKLFEVKTLTHAGNMTLRGNGGAMYLYKWSSMNL